MALKFKSKTKHRKRSQPDEALFTRSKGKLLKKGKSKMTTQESEPMHKQEEMSSTGKKGKRTKSKKAAFPIYKEMTMKKNTPKEKKVDKNKRKQMQVFSRAKSSGALEFKGDKTFGAGMVSGTIHGSKTGRGLHGAGPESRAGTRSLGNQKDGTIPSTTREDKGRKWARKREKAKVDKVSRKVDSSVNLLSDNKSSKVSSRRVMTNKVTEVVSRFKRAKSNRK